MVVDLEFSHHVDVESISGAVQLTKNGRPWKVHPTFTASRKGHVARMLRQIFRSFLGIESAHIRSRYSSSNGLEALPAKAEIVLNQGQPLVVHQFSERRS